MKTDTVCIPTEHILEGIYYDHTPEGAPRTLTSQSQQWGCQRIFPLPDRMRAKAYWTTTIVADTRYTRLLSNGAVDPGSSPGGAQPRGVGRDVATIGAVVSSRNRSDLTPSLPRSTCVVPPDATEGSLRGGKRRCEAGAVRRRRLRGMRPP